MQFDFKKQEEAISFQLTASNPSYSSWVSASAGSGKTRILVDRIIRLLLDDVKPSQILCITYTKAGASEMKERINKKLMDWATLDEDKLTNRIIEITKNKPHKSILLKARTLFANVLDDIEGLKMMTIHSFCQSLLKKFPIEAGIFPNFQVVEGSEVDELLRMTREKLLANENLPQDVHDSIKKLAVKLNKKDFTEAFSEFLEKRNKFLYLRDYKYCSNLNVEASLKNLIDNIYKICNVQKTDDEDGEFDLFVKDENFNKIDLKILAENLLGGGKTNLSNADLILEWINSSANRRKNIFAEYKSVFLTTKNEPKTIKKIIDKKILERNPKLEGIILNEQNRIFNFVIKKNSIETAKLTEAILIVGNQMLEIYSNLKAQKGIVDYDDLIIKTNNLLNSKSNKDWILYKLDSKIDHILIDEAQDTSPYQWNMISILKSEFFAGMGQKGHKNRTIFIVGDEKQSIFSFQGAEPEIFKEKHKDYEEEAKNSGKIFKNVPLDFSFRSLSSILNFVDKVFENEIERKAINFSDRKIRHNAIRNLGRGRIEIWPIIKNKKEEKQEEEPWKIDFNKNEERKPEEKLAKIIANKIINWVDNGKIINNRRISFRDIMILAKDRKNLKSVVKELQFANIPVSGMDHFCLSKELAIKDLVSLAKFTLLPGDNLSLANILKSPLIGLNEDDLFELSAKRGAKTLWQSIKTNSEYKNTHVYLENLIKQSKFLSPYEFFHYILDENNGRKKIIKRFGNHVNEILDNFLSILLNYQDKQNLTLQEILNLLDKSKQELKRDTKKEGNEVRISTVHGSKGLQSPIIILANACHTESSIFSHKNKLIENENIMIWSGSQKTYNSILEVRKKDKERTYNEYLRLLYVAITRAENELYVCSFENKKSSDKNCWYNLIKKSAENMCEAEGKDLNCKKAVFDFSSILDEECRGEGFIIGDKHKFDKEFSAIGMKETSKEEKFEHLNNLFETNPPKETGDKVIHPSEFYKYKSEKIPSTFFLKNVLKGNVIHKLLEILPNAKKQNYREIINYYMKNFLDELNDSEKDFLEKKVLDLISNEKLKEFFGKNSRSEVPIIGKIDGKIISGQIDRLVITEDEVLILDYKTTEFVPEKVPDAYKRQLDLYKRLAEKICPNKTVKTFLLWTTECSLVEVM